MSITESHIQEVQNISEYGSEFDWESNNNFIQSGIKNNFLDHGEYFRSGRDALRAIAVNYNCKYNKVLMPALSCESMVTPFELNGYEISFFKLNEDLTANFEDIITKLQTGTIFLYMNYFGIPSLNDQKLSTIKNSHKNIILIEDRTHDFLFSRTSTFIPDFTVTSIRKWLAIPDGGVLYSHINNDYFPKVEDSYFSEIRNRALKNKSAYLKSGNVDCKKEFRDQLLVASNYLDISNNIVKISQTSFDLLQKIDFKKIATYRNKNIQVLSQQLKGYRKAKNLLGNSEQAVLYYPVLVENRDEIQSKLAKQNIYCPVIWPLPKSAIGVCEVSEYISKSILALPCDQRYNESDMEYICSLLKQVLEI